MVPFFKFALYVVAQLLSNSVSVNRPGYNYVDLEIESMQYLGISEHLMLIISNVFCGLTRFEKMTEVVLGAEACNTMLVNSS